jgi:hypothetical protein
MIGHPQDVRHIPSIGKIDSGRSIQAALPGRLPDNGPVADQTRLFVLFGGFLLMGVMVLALRWTFGTGRNQPAPHIPDPDDPTGDGLLEEVSRVPTEPAAKILRSRLSDAGIRATIGRADAGYRLLVFPADLINAKLVLRSQGPD